MLENKEIKECVKKLSFCYDQLRMRFCYGRPCAKCPINVLCGDCLLCILQDSIDILKEK